MSDLLISRDGGSVHYLNTQESWGPSHVMWFGDASYRFGAAVLRFTDVKLGAGKPTEVVLQLRAGAFSFQNALTVADARLLALALNVAADEAELAAVAERSAA